MLKVTQELVRRQISCLQYWYSCICLTDVSLPQGLMGQVPRRSKNPTPNPVEGADSLEGILSLGAQSPFKNMCFLFSFSHWLRAEWGFPERKPGEGLVSLVSSGWSGSHSSIILEAEPDPSQPELLWPISFLTSPHPRSGSQGPDSQMIFLEYPL